MAFLYLHTLIDQIPGLLPVKADMLKKSLGLFTVGDVISHYPYKYIDKSKVYGVNEINENVSFIQLSGIIEDIRIEGEGYKKRLVAEFEDQTGSIQLVWFQSIEWHKKRLISGKQYLVFGKPNKFGNKYSITHPEVKQILSDQEIELSGFQPIYTTSETMKKRGMDSQGMHKLITHCLQLLDSSEKMEYLPDTILKQNNLLSLPKAMEWIHSPKDQSQIIAAQYRIKFEEFFRIQFQLQQSLNYRKTKLKGYVFSKIDEYFDRFYKNHLPFELTNAQKRVLKDIRKDVLSGGQMNRLVQGDVGSGKTIVALMCMLMGIDNEFQACMMAPTEILAKQHFEGLSNLLAPLGLNVMLLTGSVPAKQKKVILNDLLHGQIDILIGTHALIEEPVVFKNLGIAVIDEQHRFGVAQRASLWKKNTYPPHILVMTATPIPRTLAMTLYGDLDYSVIDELPPGRKPIATKHVFFAKRNQLMAFLKEEIAKGFQVYIVYPLIAESEKMDLKNLEDGFQEALEEFPAPKYSVCMVHGKMKNADKNAEMQRFVSGEAQILVSTTVIEVGVNVPNATIMVIMNAERFGLSQLHQLRGRVGRGGDQSYCFLMTDYNLNLDGRKRMEIMTSTSDGFVIAEADLKMRGPGDISGTRQSGDIQLKLANISQDAPILQQAQQLSKKIVEEDPELQMEQFKPLKHFIEKLKKQSQRWGKIS